MIGVFSGMDTHYIYPNGDEVSTVDIVYMCRQYTGTLKCQAGEVEDLRSFPLDQIPENIAKPVRKALYQWIGQNR